MSVIPTREEVPQIIRAPVAPRHRAIPVPAGAGLTGRDFVRILRKRKWMIILIALGITALAAVTTVLWSMFAPLYTAEAYLGVNAPRPSDLQGPAPLYSKDIMERIITTQIRMIKSEAVLLRATENPELKRTDWFRRTPPDKLITELNDVIDVTPVANANVIRIAMTGIGKTEEDRRELATIVNAVAGAAQEDSRLTTGGEHQRAIDRMEDQRKTSSTELARIRNDISVLRSESDMSTLQERRNVLGLRLNSYTAQLIELDMVKQQAQAAVDDLAQLERENRLDTTPEAMQRLNEDPMLRSLQFARANAVNDLEQAERKFGINHIQVRALRSRLETIDKQVTDTEARIREDVRKAVRDTRNNRLIAVQAQLLDVQRKFNETDTKARDIQAVLTQLQRLTDDESAVVKRISRIDDRLEDKRNEAKQEPPVYLRRQATVPRERTMPRWIIMMPIGVVLGLLVGLGLTFLLELIDTSIKGPSDISRKTDLPLLGMVPHSDDLEEDIPDMRLAFQSHPNSLIGEAFRQIRTCLLFSGPAERRRSLLVTSALPGDGRGTTALNLAASVARSGRKVLVVDTNFRQPMIRGLFPQCPEAGLSSALVGQASWRDLVREIEPNFWVMSSGPLPPNPAELVGSEPMRQIISEMIGQYDQVIFDGAPCLVVTDSAILSSLVDGVVLVVRAGANTYGIVHRTRDILARVGAHIVGVVLNGVRITAGGYLRKTYNTFYEYHEQARLPGG